MLKLGILLTIAGIFIIILSSYPLWTVGEPLKDQATGLVLFYLGLAPFITGSLLVLTSRR